MQLLDPIADPRWSEFVKHHAAASVFHSAAWLDALRRTYGYRPLVLTSAPAGAALSDGLAVCEIRSWRGTRLVSLPFSDHCEPLVERRESWDGMIAFLIEGVQSRRWRSIELRPVTLGVSPRQSPTGLGPANQFCFHRLDLAPGLETIRRRSHPSCIQRMVRKAERERVQYESGATPELLASFYRLMRDTRRRHGLPPQPYAWFENLLGAFGQRLTIRVASEAGTPIAAIMTLSHGRKLVYKYGGSDASRHHLGAMPFLFWRTIQEAKEQGFDELDLGRSDADQSGLIAFKDRLGGERSSLTYYRQPTSPAASSSRAVHRAASWLFERLPNPALSLAGRMLYKHLG